MYDSDPVYFPHSGGGSALDYGLGFLFVGVFIGRSFTANQNSQ